MVDAALVRATEAEIQAGDANVIDKRDLIGAGAQRP